VTRREVEIIAEFLKLTVGQVRREYLKRVGLRTTIIEHQATKDCIFLSTPLSLRGAKRRSNLNHSQDGDCHGLFQRPRNDIHTLDTTCRKCAIYSVRPSQCRSWPFWPENLSSPEAWNKAARKCPGINRGRLYSVGEIEEIKKGKKWWQDAK
jgi:Fe-S-cluster containining protein